MKNKKLRTTPKPPRSVKRTPAPAPLTPTKRAKPAPSAAKTETQAWLERRKQRQAEQAALIAADPQQAMSVAQERLDYGVELLCALIESGTLFHEIKSVDGTFHDSCELAGGCLSTRFAYLARQAAKYALAGHGDFIGVVWSAAQLLTEAVHELACDKDHARELEKHARRSLFLPSLRARATTFTHNFQEVADSIHLSEDCLCHVADTAAYKLDSRVTRLVAEVVEFIGWTQAHLKAERDMYAHTCALLTDRRVMARKPKDSTAYARRVAAMTVEEYLVKSRCCRPETLHYDSLPPLTKATADEWWAKAVRQELTRRFADLAGSRLHDQLKGVKPHEKLDDLRRRGKSALRSLARPTPPDPHPS
jgi:hypothetical protein